MLINQKTHEINLNIIYYGAASSGKTTNVKYIHANMNPSARSELFTLNTHEDRTIFFDFLQFSMGTVAGFQPKIGLYTVPGQIYYQATREAVLQRADSIVFVVDSQRARLEKNRNAWQELTQSLIELDKDPFHFPIVIQMNKRDLPDIYPVDELLSLLNLREYSFFEAIATDGLGVRETLRFAIRQVVGRAQRDATETVMAQKNNLTE